MATLRNRDIIQDGGNFYIFLPGESDADGRVQSVIYPFGRVTDYDTFTASAARRWFTGTYCARYNLNPTFV